MPDLVTLHGCAAVFGGSASSVPPELTDYIVESFAILRQHGYTDADFRQWVAEEWAKAEAQKATLGIASWIVGLIATAATAAIGIAKKAAEARIARTGTAGNTEPAESKLWEVFAALKSTFWKQSVREYGHILAMAGYPTTTTFPGNEIFQEVRAFTTAYGQIRPKYSTDQAAVDALRATGRYPNSGKAATMATLGRYGPLLLLAGGAGVLFFVSQRKDRGNVRRQS